MCTAQNDPAAGGETAPRLYAGLTDDQTPWAEICDGDSDVAVASFHGARALDLAEHCLSFLTGAR
jgi:hypothetical protein